RYDAIWRCTTRQKLLYFLYSCAEVAEVADAHDSGSCGGNPVEVQVLSSASRQIKHLPKRTQNPHNLQKAKLSGFCAGTQENFFWSGSTVGVVDCLDR